MIDPTNIRKWIEKKEIGQEQESNMVDQNPNRVLFIYGYKPNAQFKKKYIRTGMKNIKTGQDWKWNEEKNITVKTVKESQGYYKTENLHLEA